MALHLVATTGPDVGMQCVISEGQELLIGRWQGADLQLRDGYCSRKHCSARMNEGVVHLADLGSRAGTMVNGETITECRLKPGDRIRVGETEIRLQLDPEVENQSTLSPHSSSLAAAPTKVPAPELSTLIGETLHVNVIERELGQGKNGTVFLAHDTKNDRPVALRACYVLPVMILSRMRPR